MKPVWRALGGGVVWLAWVAWCAPSVRDGAWAHALLLLSALVLVPLALELTEQRKPSLLTGKLVRWTGWLQLPSALLLAIAAAREPGVLTALAAFPWVMLTGFIAMTGWLRAREGGWSRPIGKLCGDLALMFLAVGGAWTFADRAGFRPLGFDPAIVALTAVHFHFAGLLLPLLAGLVVERFPESRFAARAAVGTVLGVPAVAVGITTTQLGWGGAPEAAAGTGLALAGMAVATWHVRLATEKSERPLARAWFLLAGVSLALAMVLAALYSLRSITIPFPWLDLAWMRAVHGTVNAFGFGLGGLLAWRSRAQSIERT